jgi:YVTN family beta-propeller protein
MRAVSARPLLLPRPTRARITGAVAAVTVTASLTVLAACGGGSTKGSAATSPSPHATALAKPTASPSSTPLPPRNIYAAAGKDMLSPKVKGQKSLVYVPNHSGGTVSVIDPTTYKVIDTFATAPGSQHVVPSFDLQTLWVNNDEGGNSLTPIDPYTGKRRGPNVPVQDPYNMYFTPDGSAAIVVAEAEQRLDFRDPQTMALQSSTHVDCKGINHADFSTDMSYAIFTCEFSGRLVKINMKTRQVMGYLQLSPNGMPQDIRLDPEGRYFWVADMMANGVYIVDGATMTKVGFLPTGPEAHGIYPSRDGRFLYVSDRGGAAKHGAVTVIDPVTEKVVAQWVIPGGGTPDMGGVTADGTQLWLSGRRDNVVYVFDTRTGKVIHIIPVGLEPHGLAVWPQPGRFSLGHTGNMR